MAKNFRNEIVWCYSGASNVGKDFPRKHDIVFRYSKTDNYILNKDLIRIPYAESTITRSKHKGTATNSMPLESREVNKLGKIPETWWKDIAPMHNLRNEKLGYPTQKPEKLLERIIKASTNE